MHQYGKQAKRYISIHQEGKVITYSYETFFHSVGGMQNHYANPQFYIKKIDLCFSGLFDPIYIYILSLRCLPMLVMLNAYIRPLCFAED